MEKLLAILGAGSSSPLGMPSVSDLDGRMEQWGAEWAKRNGTTDHFQELWDSAKMYYKRGPTGPRPALNFEKVLGDMVAMAHWMEPPPWGDTLRQAASGGAPPPHMKFRYRQEPKEEVPEVPLLVCGENDMLGGECEVTGESSVEDDTRPEVESTPDHAEDDWKGKYGAYIELMDEYSFLFGRLAQHMRAESQRLNSANTPEKEKYRELFRGLRKGFDVGVYNLNYDTAALDALPGAYTGFGDTGTFEPSVVHERIEWDFVYHLHGSVHHSLNCRYDRDKIVWRRDLDDEFFDDPEGRWADKRSEGRPFPRTTLVAGGFKLDQLLVEPFQSFHASLVRHVYGANAILICGYGFGDAHINRALHNRLSHSQGRPPVMVLDRACDKPGLKSVEDRANWNDPWAVQLKQTLCAGGFKPSSHASFPRGVFEEASNCRVGVWYGGFIDAERRLRSILEWLERGADNVLVPGPAQGV